MSSRSRILCGSVIGKWVLLAVAFGTVGTLAAQDQVAPSWELYGGYSFFQPAADVHGQLPGGLLPVSSRLEANPRGVGASVTYNFNRWLGLTGDISGHWGSGETGVAERIDDAAFYNISLGPKLTFRRRHFSPFLEAMLSGHRLTSDVLGRDDRIGFMVGGSLDLNLNRHFALRLLRADYVFSNHQFGPDATVPATEVRGARLQSGVVVMFGGRTPPTPPTASCSAQPNEVMAGDAVIMNAAAGDFNPRHTLTYQWSSTGGQVTDTGAAATIHTDGLGSGSYTATARVTDSEARRNGRQDTHRNIQAICSANFLVKEPPKNPPVVTCLANPSTVQAGSLSIIRCTCTSPDDLPITVSGWTTSDGIISGSGDSVALNTSGASAGPISVSATCNDSRGLNTQTTAQVMVENPPTPSPEFLQLEARLVLRSIYFPTARPNVQNPDGGLLASQRRTLVALAYDFRKYLETKPDAHLTLEGHADPRASLEYNQALSERRVERTKRFLIEHGVPAANIETKAFGQQQNLSSAQVKEAVEHSPDLTPPQRQRVLSHMITIVLASNRRVDVTVSTTGQRSVRQYPFNAADSLTLIQQ
jgi:outer membrane protein OmpA-like peptidoglycan-associated protein